MPTLQVTSEHDGQRAAWWLCMQAAVAYQGGGCLEGSTPPPRPEIPMALQNRAKLNPIVKTVKNC